MAEQTEQHEQSEQTDEQTFTVDGRITRYVTIAIAGVVRLPGESDDELADRLVEEARERLVDEGELDGEFDPSVVTAEDGTNLREYGF